MRPVSAIFWAVTLLVDVVRATDVVLVLEEGGDLGGVVHQLLAAAHAVSSCCSGLDGIGAGRGTGVSRQPMCAR